VIGKIGASKHRQNTRTLKAVPSSGRHAKSAKKMCRLETLFCGAIDASVWPILHISGWSAR